MRKVWAFPATAIATVLIVGAGLWWSEARLPDLPPARGSLPTFADDHEAMEFVAVIGDSFTSGSREGGTGLTNWTLAMEPSLKATHPNVITRTSAKGGAGYVHGLDKGFNFDILAQATVYNTDDVVVLFGGLHDIEENQALVYETAVTTIGNVKDAAPEATVLVVGPAWTQGPPSAGVRTVMETIRHAAEASRVTFVDPVAEGWFISRGDLIGSDNLQPTDEGHKYLAEKMAPHVLAALDRATAH
ncbi:MAG: SGNH/GDSL hydrolase family protein [Hyphomicrobiales bacterium]|nr:MAG: SGNH/GDSL hydrolase family protein [Hyphomicrobiales bacterium]